MVPLPGQAQGWGLPAFGGAARCAAFPLFVVRDVPYSNGMIVGRNYRALAGLAASERSGG